MLVIFSMYEFEINSALNESFNFSVIDDDILKSDFSLNYNAVHNDNLLDGIQPSSDSEDDNENTIEYGHS